MLIKKITAACLAPIRKRYSLTHLVLWCKSDEGQYIISSGDNPDHSVQATLLANRFRQHLGWPKMTFETAPKIAEALAEIQKLKAENQRLRDALDFKNRGGGHGDEKQSVE